MHSSSTALNSLVSDESSARIRLYEIAYALCIPANLIFYFVMNHAGYEESIPLRAVVILSAVLFLTISRVRKLTFKQADNLFMTELLLHAVNSVWLTHINHYNTHLILGALTLLCCATPFITSRTRLIAFTVSFGGVITLGSYVYANTALPGLYFFVTSLLMIPAMIIHHSIYERLSLRTARLNNIFNNAASGIVQLGASGRILQTNRRFAEMAEYKEAELLSLTITQICHEEDKETLKAFLYNASTEISPQTEIRLQSKYGKFMWVRLVASNQAGPSMSDDLILLVLDISQEKKLNELSAFQKQILLMFARKVPFNHIIAEIAKFVSIQTGGLPVVISLLKTQKLHVAGSFNLPDNLLDTLNARPAKSGYGNALDAIRRKALNLNSDIKDSAAWEEYRRDNPKSPLVACWAIPIISETGEPAGVIEVFKYTEGTPNFTVIQTLDICSSLTGLAIMVHNSEELQKTYLANFTQTAKLASLGEMAAGIAHEINNPMTIIQGRAEQIQHILQSDPPDLARIGSVAENIMKNVQRVAKIIRGLRAFARFNVDSEFQAADISEIIHETLDLCSERFKVHGVQLRLGDIDRNLKIRARGPQISQVLLNLFNNAFDAVSERHNERWVDVRVVETVEFVQVTVTDSGNGIAPDVAERLFQPFFTTKGVDKGTGLGLSISHGIVADHGGRIYIDRNCANTRFVVELPKFQEPLVAQSA